MSVSTDPTPKPAGSKDHGDDEERKGKTLAWTSSTYFAEGLPWSLLHQVAAEYFTGIGVAPAKVGYTSLLHGPTLLKVIWSPVLDLWGTLRGWMVATQALMGVLIGFLAVFAHRLAQDPARGDADTTVIWALLLGVGVLSATHDIACDGYYMHALDSKRQARFSGVRVAAFRAAMLVGSSGLVFLAGRVNWLVAFGAGGSILISLALGHQLFLPRTGAVGAGSSKALQEARPSLRARLQKIGDSYLSFLRQDAVVLVIAFLLTYKMADVLMFSMSKVLLGRELGIGTDLRGAIGFFSTTGSILGAVWGGAWIARKGLKNTLFVITSLMVFTEPLYALLATFAPSLSIFHGPEATTMDTMNWSTDGLTLVIVTTVIVIEQVCGGLATAAQMVFIMQRCHPAHMTAHFAFATVVYSTAQMAVGSMSGWVYQGAGSIAYFWIVSALALPAVGLAWRVSKG